MMANGMIAPAVARAVAELEQHFEIDRSLEDGANGYVFVGRNKLSGQDVVIKFYAGDADDKRHNEPRLLFKVDSPNVLPILDARVVSDEWAYFATPHCTGGNLDTVIASHPSALAAIDLVLGVCAGASAIHGVGLVHRDLKPANIVCEGDTPLIADFGSVRELGADSTVTSKSGHAILYRPPESIPSGQYSVQGDIYQIGIVAFQLLGGVLSYEERDHLSKSERATFDALVDPVDRSLFVDSAITKLAQSGKLIRLATLPPWVSRRIRDCIRRMTAPDPAERYARLSDATADILRARSAQPDWKRTAAGARLCGERSIVVSEVNGTFEARFESTGRRVRNSVVGDFADVIKSVHG